MPTFFDLAGKLFRKQPTQAAASESNAGEEPISVTRTETSERLPWSIERVLHDLGSIQPLDTREVLRALASQQDRLAIALRGCLPAQTGKGRVTAAAFLLMLGDDAGREPFLEALGGPDGEARNLAIDYINLCIYPNDIDVPGPIGTNCPISSDEVFAALERDLHEPWTGLSETALRIVATKHYPQARAITLPLLSHSDPALRLMIAKSYLRAGRDEGAFDIVEHVLRGAPPYLHDRDPGWRDFHAVKSLWYTIEEAARRGDDVLRGKAASLCMASIEGALDAPDVNRRFNFNDGLINLVNASNAIALAMPAGGKALLKRVIGTKDLSPDQRGQVLSAYCAAMGEAARPTIIEALRGQGLRRYAARAFEPLLNGDNDPQAIAALSAALEGEERPVVVAALAKALLAAGPEGRSAVERALEHAEPWARIGLSWRISGGTDRELADLLTGADVMDAIDDEALEKASANGLDIRSLLFAGGDRLVVFSVKASSGLEHFELFERLLKVTRPVIVVQGLKEVVEATLMREPVSGAPQVERVTDLGTVCAISFDYLGQTFGFDAHPEGRWHDVASVTRGFDDFMRAIGRDDRCYELRGDGEWGMFVVAPASKFEPVAARLKIPIETDPASARDAAKAFQRQVQNR